MKSELWLAATKAAWKQLDKLSTPNINLKISNRGKEIEEIDQSKATKIHLWINFISQLTRRIEVACESKIEVKSYAPIGQFTYSHRPRNN